MTDSGLTPSQFQLLREDIAAMRTEWNQRFDNLVTRETFLNERRRVDDRFQDLERRFEERFRELVKVVSELETALNLESQARQNERAEALKAQVTLNNERDGERRVRAWQWLLTGVSLVTGPVLGALIANTIP